MASEGVAQAISVREACLIAEECVAAYAARRGSAVAVIAGLVAKERALVPDGVPVARLVAVEGVVAPERITVADLGSDKGVVLAGNEAWKIVAGVADASLVANKGVMTAVEIGVTGKVSNKGVRASIFNVETCRGTQQHVITGAPSAPGASVLTYGKILVRGCGEDMGTAEVHDSIGWQIDIPIDLETQNVLEHYGITQRAGGVREDRNVIH